MAVHTVKKVNQIHFEPSCEDIDYILIFDDMLNIVAVSDSARKLIPFYPLELSPKNI